MKIDLAYVCFNCREIQHCAPHGKCETCGSEDVHPLTQFVNLDARVKVFRKLVLGRVRRERKIAMGGGFSNPPSSADEGSRI